MAYLLFIENIQLIILNFLFLRPPDDATQALKPLTLPRPQSPR
jgi:hypothetical protein